MRSAAWIALCLLLAAPPADAAHRKAPLKSKLAKAKAKGKAKPTTKVRAPASRRALADPLGEEPPASSGEESQPQEEEAAPVEEASPQAKDAEDPFLAAAPRSAELAQIPRSRAEAEPTPAAEVGSQELPFRRRKQQRQPAVRLSAGSQLLTHGLSFSTVDQTSLRAYRAPLVVAPRFQVEGYPLGFFLRGPVADLGLALEHSFAAGLKARYGPTGVFPVSMSRTDLALTYRLALDERLRLVPSLGVTLTDFAVAAGEDGQTLDGVPSVSTQAARAALDAELRLGSFGVFGRLALGYAFSVGGLSEPRYGGQGGALSLGASAGASVALFGPVELAAQLELARTAYSLRPEGATASVTAVDLSLGGAVAVRAAF